MSEIPGRYADQFNLRLPDGMRDRLKAEAEANKRSMNAEIVARLEASLDDPTTLKSNDQDQSNTLYVLLDTNGLPISLQEALTHLNEINKAGKFRFSSQNAKILASEQVSSSVREDDDFALFMKYRRMNGHLLSKKAAAFLAEYETREDPEGTN